MSRNGYHHVTLAQRCQIQALLSIGKSQRAIAEKVGISQSAVSREIARNSTGYRYSHSVADGKSVERRSGASKVPKKLKSNLELQIVEHINEDWSPEQISGRLKLQGISVSHETIYSYIRADKANGGSLFRHLRHAGKKYKKRLEKSAGASLIPNRVDIAERPAVVEEKSRLGDWEGDTIISSGSKTPLLTVVDRKSKLVKMKKLPDKTSQNTSRAIVKILKPMKNQVHTITFDNGGEFAKHAKVAKKLGAKTFFARPYHSWERGLNEHTNGLIRQYLPKKIDFKDVTDKKIKEIENKLNNRPRKVLKFMTPLEVFLANVDVPLNDALQT
jgi:IS30 family transposase